MRLLAIGAFASGCFTPHPPTGSPCLDGHCPSSLVCSAATQTCELVDRDAAIVDMAQLIDAAPPVTGSGTPGSPYVPTGTPRKSCADFLATYPSQAKLDGVYRVRPAMSTIDVYCDMTTDGGGWTLIARVLSTSLTHATPSAIGTLTSPSQTTTAKLADATINQLAFMHARLVLETVGTIYAKVSALDFSPTEFSTAAAASPTLAGPYTYDFLTQTGCTSDCGVNVARPNIGFGNNCGYQFYASQGEPRPGMGCQGDHTKNGTAWVR